jgi:hypothetical protein
MAQPVQPSPPRAVNPRHLGLPRRQSYDPLSTTKSLSQSLSLGNLPPPQFGNLSSGQRSVPAVESSRLLGGSAFRSVSGPGGDGQRTPGGSLVVGSEVFGFGRAKEGRERWGDGSVEGEDGAGEGDEQTPTGAATQLENAPTNWPREFEKGVTGTTTGGEFKSKDGDVLRGKHASESSSVVSRCGPYFVPPSMHGLLPTRLFLSGSALFRLETPS